MSGRTLGLAIEVPPPFGTRVDEARAGYEPGHHRMPAHITLIPPFDADDEAVLAVRQHCEGVARAHVPFEVRLRGTGSFRPASPVAYVDVTGGADACAALEAALRTGPLAFESRFAYHAHVTLAHADDDAVLDRALADFADAQASFAVTAFRLYEHRDGTWVPIGEHRLGS